MAVNRGPKAKQTPARYDGYALANGHAGRGAGRGARSALRRSQWSSVLNVEECSILIALMKKFAQPVNLIS